jgi:transcription termination factor Rho
VQELENNDSQSQTDESTMQQISETPAVTEAAPTDTPVADDSETEGRSSRTLKLNRSSSEADSSETAAENESVAAAEAATESGADDGNGENGGGRGRRGRQRRGRREPHVPSENPLSLTELKTKSTQELIDMANEMGIENVARSRKQDIIFSILKKHAKSGEDIW